jgi:hypothetical protein
MEREIMTIHKSVNDKPKCGARGRWLYLEDSKHKATCKRCLGQMKRRENSNTVNRGWLMRRILEGKVLAKCNGVYTDDYAFDAAYNFQKTGWLKAKIEDNYSQRQGNFIYFRQDEFRGFGHAWRDANGDISLSFGYRSYTMRIQ